jgi:Esterase-like activity of phytase
VAYTGFNNVFLTVPDRGPFDGRTDVLYRDRFHFMRIRINSAGSFPNISTTLLDTRFLKAGRRNFVGDSSAFDVRFDPEGVSVGLLGTFYVSDEYGPYINEFLPTGQLLRRIHVPAKFSRSTPSRSMAPAAAPISTFGVSMS